jgi:hypothetical protein
VISSFEIGLQPNVPARINVVGAFFRLVGGVDVGVTFYRSGARVGQAGGMSSGFYARSRPGEVFDSVELLTSSAQTVKALIGEAEAGAAAEVSVSGEVVVSQRLGVMAGKSVASVGVASSAFRGQELRRYLFLQNLAPVGGGVVFVMPDGVAALNTGYKLEPGDSLTFDVWVPQATLYAIATAAETPLSFVIGI